MKYYILKGAGLSAHSVHQILLAEYDTANPNNVIKTHYTKETFGELVAALKAIPDYTLVFSWNFAYEAKALINVDPDFTQSYFYKHVDLFKLIHIQFNQMVSFYRFLSFGSSVEELNTTFNMEVLTDLVKQVPSAIQNGNSEYVTAYLEQYAMQYARLIRHWEGQETMIFRASTKDRIVDIHVGEMSTAVKTYYNQLQAIRVLPKHCLKDEFNL